MFDKKVTQILEKYTGFVLDQDEALKTLKVLNQNEGDINMTPFIAERLGVEVGEKFKIAEMAKTRENNGLDVVFMIRDDGTYTTIPENVKNSSIAILKAINDPEHQVIKCFKITGEEKENLKILFKIWPDSKATIRITENETIEINSPGFKYHDCFHCTLYFPSLTKNEKYNLYNLILGSAENA